MRRSVPRDTLRCWATLALACAALAGCRERDSFRPEEARPPVERAGEAWQVTYSIGDDRAPSWAPGSDSIYYAAEAFAGLPDAPGVLLSVPRDGGAVVPLVPEQVASTRARWFTAPDRAGDRLAWAEVVRLNEPLPCAAPFSSCAIGAERRVPPLGYIGLRTRPAAGAAPLPDQPPLLLQVAGRSATDDTPFHVDSRWHPFQTVFHEDGHALFRPSWAPDGSRLVFSDGLRLLVWTAGAGDPVPIPGTEDGVSPAWSPAGDWIAYTRLARGDSAVSECSFYTSLSTVCHERRVAYAVTAREVVVVSPDGGQTREVLDGEQPAWNPGGTTLYVRRGGHIWRQSLLGGAAQRLPGTDGGGEPAVSPDGRFLAFTRLSSAGNHDVWVLPLEVAP
ncbi:MAG TPA: hypothetical protein VMK65_08610 [Longimicrobiales bacterium]|nr:hypothetical protein [Longimicrobiales bacterium]